jgi:hypothetical protein
VYFVTVVANRGNPGMAGEAEDPEDAAARLEAALERIAQLAGTRPPPSESATEGGGEQMPPIDEIAARLDGLIDRLRKALGGSSGGTPG